MKKGCIVTVYNSENCGSYWQAFALKEYLTTLGYEISFLERKKKGTSHSIISLTKRCLGHLKRFELKKIIDSIKQFCVFEKYSSKFITTKECSSNFDVCLLGSDTIWNLDSAYFRNNRKIFFGATSKAKKTVSYAASFANTSKTLVAQFPELKDYVENLDGVSVRDEYTKNVLRSFTQKEVLLVCDPTLLFDKTFYQNRLTKKAKEKKNKSIFVYYFGKMPKVLETKVKEFAKENSCEIVSMGGSMKKGVRNLPYDPYVFIECFENAEFVLTNTFHGIIFTLLFEKPAVFNSDGKNKVKELLNICQIENCDCFGDFERLNEYFEKKDIDYTLVRKRINELRSKSKYYLEIM